MNHNFDQEGASAIMSLGQVIRQRRKEMGLTQEELAERIGDTVRQAEISRLENDHIGLPRRSRLESIARALGLPLGVLLSHSGWTGAEVIEIGPEESAEIKREALQVENVDLEARNARLLETVEHLTQTTVALQSLTQQLQGAASREATAHQELRAIIDGVDDAVVVVAGDGSFVLQNEAFSEKIGIEDGSWFMIDDCGERIVEDATPFRRAARGETFTMSMSISRSGKENCHEVSCHPVLVAPEQRLGVVTIKDCPDPN